MRLTATDMELEEFAARLRQCRDIVFFTGAGISTESGVPDFRSPGGVWTKYQPVYFQDFVASEAARIRHWQLKKATYELYKTVQPNIGHYAIRDFEKRGQLLGLVTQNIDGLHGISGVSDDKIVELHGTDRLVTCLECGKRFEPASVYEPLAENFTAPTCDACGGFKKSANVSFGQQMPAKAMQPAREEMQKKAVEHVLKRLEVKEPPPLSRIFDFSMARKVVAGIPSKGWKPGP
ncbi:MAG TPA: Sir2 family NAD-dependent protein deacetylase [Candidatus Binatia bacterium]|nr:Sir2 family NAD-dependent protein deacetylase [Candidatus Binatia bacterium]